MEFDLPLYLLIPKAIGSDKFSARAFDHYPMLQSSFIVHGIPKFKTSNLTWNAIYTMSLCHI